MFDSEREAKDCLKGDVVLVRDINTGLIFNQAFKPDLMIYDSAYQNEQAVSTVFQAHLGDVSKIIHEHFSGTTGSRISSPQEAISTLQAGAKIMVMNSKYLPEIQRQMNYQFNYMRVDHDTVST